MILTTALLVSILGGTSTFALPLSRMQQDAAIFTEALGPWMTACQAQSGGQYHPCAYHNHPHVFSALGQYCVELSYNGVRALGATAAVCDQQDVADTMIKFAKTLSNSTELVGLTRVFAQQPRSSADGLSVLYCQDPPIATELRGLYACQSADYDLTKFTGSVAIGSAGTMPYGLTAAVTPAGSCPDHSGPVPSGEYLTSQSNKVSTSKSRKSSTSTSTSRSHQSKSSAKRMTLSNAFVKRDDAEAAPPAEEGDPETMPADDGTQTADTSDPRNPPAEASAE